MTAISTRFTVPSAIMSAQCRQVGSDFPLAACCRHGGKARMLCTDDVFQRSLVAAVDCAVAIVVEQSLVRADDVVLGVPTVQSDHDGWRDVRHVEALNVRGLSLR